jgi:hypothetical protein
MDLRKHEIEETARNKKTGIVIFLISIAMLMLMTAATCQGQVCFKRDKPFYQYPDITRLISCRGAGYEANGKNIFVGIFADSINPKKYMIVSYVFINNNVTLHDPKLFFTFEDGSYQEMLLFSKDSISGYSEFIAKDNELANIRDKKINAINFVNDGIEYSVVEEKFDLFCNFIKGL